MTNQTNETTQSSIDYKEIISHLEILHTKFKNLDDYHSYKGVYELNGDENDDFYKEVRGDLGVFIKGVEKEYPEQVEELNGGSNQHLITHLIAQLHSSSFKGIYDAIYSAGYNEGCRRSLKFSIVALEDGTEDAVGDYLP